ncbi:MAG: CC_3452 family protein [Novosphingobium sp.]
MKTAVSRAFALVLMPLSLASAALPITASPALAANGGYTATLAAPLDAPKQKIIGEVLWKCAGDRCTAGNMGGRPVVTCQRVAKEFGEVSRFASGGKEFSAEDIAKCNGK